MFKIITIPFDRKMQGFDDEILSSFVLNKKIKSYQSVFFNDSSDSYWTVFVEYDPLIESSPAESDLDDTQKILYDQLKIWRKERAEKEGVPVYIIATNKELANLVKTSPKTLESFKNIKGFGKSKASKYGEEIIAIITAFYANPS